MSNQLACLSIKENLTISELTAEPMPVNHIISSGVFLMHMYLESRLAEIMQMNTQYILMEETSIAEMTVFIYLL